MRRPLLAALLLAALGFSPASGQDSAEPRIEGNVMIFDAGERLDLARQEIAVEATFCLQKGPIELLACAPGGKDHESILVLKCKPQNLHLALISLGLRDKTELGGGGPQVLGDAAKPVGDRVVMEVEFEHNGKKTRVRAEDLVLSYIDGKPMARAGWVFAGSSFVDESDPETGKPTGRKVYLANRYRSIVTTYHDPTTLLDNPTLEGGNDDIFGANPDVLPAPGTVATVILRLPTEAESKEMAEIEAAVDARVKEMMAAQPKPTEGPKPDEGGEKKE